MEWKLTAELDGVRRTVPVEFEPRRYDDPDSVLTAGVIAATFEVIDRASRSRLWAKGAITLTDEAGTVIETMEAK